MKLSQLRKLLEKLSKNYDDCDVWVQADSEGNGYEELYDIGIGLIEGHPEDSGVLSESEDWEDAGFESEEEWKQWKMDAERIVILAP